MIKKNNSNKENLDESIDIDIKEPQKIENLGNGNEEKDESMFASIISKIFGQGDEEKKEVQIQEKKNLSNDDYENYYEKILGLEKESGSNNSKNFEPYIKDKLKLIYINSAKNSSENRSIIKEDLREECDFYGT